MLKRIGAEESGEFKAVASGTLPSGKAVIVNADGTVSSVGIGAASIGSAVIYENAASADNATAYDTSNDKIVIAYRDSANSQYHTAVVGTVSGTSISFGTPVVVTSNYHYNQSINFDTNAGKMVIVSADPGNGTYGRAIVGTVSGTSISFGSVATFYSNAVSSVSSTYDSTNNKIIIAYADGAASNTGKAIVGTVSGTSISFGSVATFNDAVTSVYQRSIVYDSSTGKTVIAFRDTGSSNQGKAVVATVSGTSISFGSETMFESGATQDINAVYDSGNSKVNIFYEDGADGDKLKGVIGTVSGTSISFTAVQELYTAATVSALSATYDSNAATSVTSFRGASAYGYALPITSDGSSLTVGSSTTITTNAYGSKTSSAFDPDQKKVVIAYQDGDDSDKGKAQVYDTAATTLTSENYIGMSRGVVNVNSIPDSAGTPVVFETGSTNFTSAIYDSTNQKVVIPYRDDGNAYYGTAIVGTVSGTSISFGSPTVFESANTVEISAAYDSNAQKVVIAYRDAGNSNYGTAIVGTVSGTSISFGSPVVFESANSQSNSIVYDSNAQKVVIAYKDAGNSNYGTAIVGTVGGTNISFGSPTVFESATTSAISATFDSTNQKVVIAYMDGGNSYYGTAIVGTVSGTSISFGSAAVFENSETSNYIAAIYDSTNQKVVIAYRNDGGSNYGTAAVGTVSGTGISFGTPVVFESANTFSVAATFDPTNQKVVIAYKDNGNSNYGTAIVGTVSGTSISFGTALVFETGSIDYPSATFDSSNNKVVIAYKDAGNSDQGTAVVFQAAGTETIRAEVASGQAASMDIIGSVSDNQIGLTAGQQYFVQTDGTIGTTAADPSVLAGTAISATELVVKT